jgi:hypothetical protein
MTTNADYHADPAISASHLKAVMQVAVSLLEPLPRSKAPNHGAHKRHASGQPRALRSAGA